MSWGTSGAGQLGCAIHRGIYCCARQSGVVIWVTLGSPLPLLLCRVSWVDLKRGFQAEGKALPFHAPEKAVSAFSQPSLRATTISRKAPVPRERPVRSSWDAAGRGAVPGLHLWTVSLSKLQLCSSAHQIAALESKYSSPPSLPFFRCKFKFLKEKPTNQSNNKETTKTKPTSSKLESENAAPLSGLCIPEKWWEGRKGKLKLKIEMLQFKMLM